MPEPTICVALDSTNVDDMVDEAARASTAGADLVEVRFDRLYLTKPEPVVIEQEDGESKSVMPPEAEGQFPMHHPLTQNKPFRNSRIRSLYQ